MSKRLERALFRNVRNASLKYGMLQKGDRVAVAVSGGKDSLCLLYMMDQLKQHTPLSLELVPICVDLGWGNSMASTEEFCASLGYSLHIEETNIGQVVFASREESNPCALCANLRRGALHRAAAVHNCGKVALGHHMDDLLATFFMSMLYESRVHIYHPCTYLDRSGISLIRPLLYVDKRHIDALTASLQLQPARNLCPADGHSARRKAGDIVDMLEMAHPGAKRRMISAIEKLNDPGIYNR